VKINLDKTEKYSHILAVNLRKKLKTKNYNSELVEIEGQYWILFDFDLETIESNLQYSK